MRSLLKIEIEQEKRLFGMYAMHFVFSPSKCHPRGFSFYNRCFWENKILA
jgi:hypothetical protein